MVKQGNTCAHANTLTRISYHPCYSHTAPKRKVPNVCPSAVGPARVQLWVSRTCTSLANGKTRRVLQAARASYA